jgi:hypothetical protein
MAKKRQSKPTRKAAKRQRSTSSKPWVSSPPQQTRPAIKISEAILTLAEPLRTQYRDPHRMQAIVAIAVMAWNMALFPDEEHADVQGMLLESLPPQLSGEDVGVLLRTMDTLEFIPTKPSVTKGSDAPGNCAGHNRVPSPDHGSLASTGGSGPSRCDSASHCC